MPGSRPSLTTTLPGLTLEAVEWLPSGGETGLVRVRAHWGPDPDRHPAGLPALCARGGEEEVERFESLPDAAEREPSVWRGAYLAPERALGGELWLQWESGERAALTTPAGLEAEAGAGLPVPAEAASAGEPGGQVIDRAVMAERRARRAEASEQAQARVAAEALRAVEALDRRGGELERLVEALAAERDSHEAGLAEARAELEQVRADLAGARESAAGFESALAAGRAAQAALADELASALDEASAAAASLRAEALARAALDAGLDRERVARADDRSALDSLRADLEAERAARASDRAALATLRADLDAERAARDADRNSAEGLRAELESARAALARAESALAEARRDEGRLLQRAAEQARAAASAARPSPVQSGQLVADLDAAAAALRASVPALEQEAETAVARPTIVSARGVPPRAHATGESQRTYPWLRGALVKLAHDDPRAAGLALAGLLPVQAVIVEGTLDYDLTIAEVGTFSVTVAAGRAYVVELEAPRGRRQAEFHLSADALSLAELVAGVSHPIRRFRGPVRIRGRKRRLKPLRAIQGTQLSLGEAARAGARLEPGVVFGAFPYVIHPSWSRGHSFTIAQKIAGDPPETWYLSVGNGGIEVSQAPPPGEPDASVSMSRETFGHLLNGEQAPRGQRPKVRGDREAVALLKGWLDRAQEPRES